MGGPTPEAARASDPEVRFRLLASVVAGRPMTLAPASGPGPYTDGRTVFLPAAGDRAVLLAGALLHCGLLAGGSLDALVLEELERDVRLARRYLALEGARIVPWLAAELPGAAGAFERLGAPAPLTATPRESLERARADRRVPPPPAAFGRLRPRLVLATSVAERAAEPAARPPIAAPAEAGDDAGPGDGEDDDAAPGGRWSQWFRSLLGIEESGSGRGAPGDGGSPDALIAWSGARPVGSAWQEAVTTANPGRLVDPGLGTGGRRAFVYPEWDAGRGEYRLDWCVVRELDPRLDELVVGSHPGPDHNLRRSLAPLGTSLGTVRRQPEGDDLDLDALVELRVDVRAGGSPAGRVYTGTARWRRELGVLVLLDVSSSASEASPSGGIVNDHQRELAVRLVGTLAELGDRVAAYGFRSRGRKGVELLRVKTFDGAFDAASMERLDALRPAEFTRLGAAVRHATHLLDRSAGASHRVLVVVSDGFAYDDGYDLPYGEADARRALMETRTRGIGSLCLAVGARDTDERLRRVFGTSAFAAAATYEHMRPQLGTLIHHALASAEHRARHRPAVATGAGRGTTTRAPR